MEIVANLVPAILSALADRPRCVFEGAGCSAHIAVPDYDEHLARHYKRGAGECRKALGFSHFGVVVDFDRPVELKVHDDGGLDENLRMLLDHFGPVLLRNVQLPAGDRTSAQRNIFPSLKFHIDRGRLQAEQISMFWRDPRDPIQVAPRSSSTLIMPNHAAYLQALDENHGEHDFKSSYEFFGDTDASALIGKVLFELPWNAGHGVGEIALLDNRKVMHASYYPRASDKGYPISVRYLL